MIKSVAIVISPNWKNYAKKYLKDCLESIRKQDYQGEMKVFITDNETSAESVNFLMSTAPEAELILNKKNDGFAKGNNDSIRQGLAQNFDYVFLLNMDAVAEPNCISQLIETAEEDDKIGAIQPRIMLWNNKDKINSFGNTTHFLGFGYSEGYKESIAGRKIKIQNIGYFSGAAVLLKSGILREVGLFDEKYWMYNEDQELGWRLWLAGYRCVINPQAVVYHKYEFGKSIKQFYWLDRNRILAILECYHILTLWLVLPAFIVMEIGLILFSIKSGWFKEKMSVWAYFLKPKNILYIIKARKRNQKLRKVKEKNIIKLIKGKIWYQEVDDWKLRVINPFFNLYWEIIKKIIIW